MRIKGAMTILKKEMEFLGLTLDELLVCIERNPYAFSIKKLEAHEVYMQEHGYIWCGLNGHGWIKPEKMQEIYNIWSSMGHQLELEI